MIISNKSFSLSFIVTYILLFTLFFSCKEEEIDQNEYSKNLLMSTGWRFEKCILTLNDYSEIVMDSIVSFNLTSDMSMPDYKNTLIDEWMVFPKDTARFEYRYTGYTRDKGEVEWTKNQTQNVELWAKWGFYPDGSLYMDYAYSRFPWVSKMEILSEDSFIIRAARRPWFAHLDWDNELKTYYVGDYPLKTVIRIDMIYKRASADDKGPNYSPPWGWWPH